MNKINPTSLIEAAEVAEAAEAARARAEIARRGIEEHYKAYNEATDDAARSASRKDFIDSRQEYLRAHTTLARLAKLS